MDEDEVLEQLKGLVSDVKAVKTAAQKEGVDLDGRIRKLTEEIETRGKETSEIKTAYQEQVEKFDTLLTEHKGLTEQMAELQRGPGGASSMKSLGQRAAESQHLKGFADRGVSGKHFLVDFNDSQLSLVQQVKAVTSAGDSAGTLVEPLRAGLYLDPLQPLTVRDLLTAIPTNSPLIQYQREKVFINSAAPVAERALKPESDMTFEPASAQVEVIAHWIKVTNQILADVPRLRGTIDLKMTHGLKLREEQQLLLGDGNTPNLHGLLPQATAYDIAIVGGALDETRVDRMRRAILQSDLAGYPTDALVMSPIDWADIELMKTDDNAYLFTNPQTGTGQMLWGRRVVSSLAMPVKQFIAGSLRLGATLYDREAMSVRVADQHEGVFTTNEVIILVEERVGLAVERPQSIISGTFA